MEILLIVGMFLTGFESKSLNLIIVDKNFKYLGLIQVYSRTNRTMGRRKSQGNVVYLLNLKSVTNQAIEPFASKEAIEEDEIRFIQAIRELMRIKNVLSCFIEFSFDDLSKP